MLKTALSFAAHFVLLLTLGASLSARANQAGALDPTFDGDGKRTLAFDLSPDQDGMANDDLVEAVVAAPGGRIYLVGTANIGLTASAIGLARLRHDGALDEAFGAKGSLVRDVFPGRRVAVSHAALQIDGKLLVAGYTMSFDDFTARPMICRFAPNGDPDPLFGDAESPGCRSFDTVRGYYVAVLALDDGGIVIAGSYLVADQQKAVLLRLRSDGSTDSEFGTDGVVEVESDFGFASFLAVAATTDDHLFTTGWTLNTAEHSHDVLVLRVDSKHGIPDPGFGTAGIKVISVDAGASGSRRSDAGTDVHPSADGSLLVIGNAKTDYSLQPFFSNRPFAIKLLPSGELDPTFGGGIRIYNPCPVFVFDCDVSPGVAGSSFAMKDGRFVIAGRYRYSQETGDFFAMRLLPDGDLDLNFGSQVIGQEATALVDFGLVPPEQSLDGASSAFIDGERIVLAGYASAPPVGDALTPNLDFAVARLDHGLDQTFVVSSESVGNGVILPDFPQNVGHSDHVEFDVTPLPGYRIESVDGCGGALYGDVYTTGPIVADCKVSATFALLPVAIFADGFEQ